MLMVTPVEMCIMRCSVISPAEVGTMLVFLKKTKDEGTPAHPPCLPL